MLQTLINSIWSALEAALTWLLELLDGVGEGAGFGVAIISAFVLVASIYKYIISPYITGSGSDRANKKKGK